MIFSTHSLPILGGFIMVTIAQRIELLRTQRGLSRPSLSAALGLPRMSIEKFETGRQTPSQDQQNKIASYFNVSVSYLRGESDDPTSMANWMTVALSEAEEEPVPVRRAPAAPKPQPASGQNGAILAAMLSNKAFHDTIRAEILEILRSAEGAELLANIVKKEIDKQK
jgi:transcriptional regulator with XRE-family HTH domain